MAWTEIEEVRRRLVGLRLDLALLRLSILEAKYRPDQPRAPAGEPDGGQWIDDDAGAPMGAHVDDGVFRPDTDDDPVVVGVAQASRPPVDLRTEGTGGQHAIEKHVAKSNAQLKALMESTDYHGLFQTAYTLQPVGSYDSIGSANAYTNDVINSHPEEMEAVVSGREPRAYLQKRYSSPTGREVDRKILPLGQVAEVFQPTFTVAVVVEHVPGRKGFRVVTSFPMNKKPNRD